MLALLIFEGKIQAGLACSRIDPGDGPVGEIGVGRNPSHYRAYLPFQYDV
ncbi:hypothetical protein JCM14036_14760 [Desulfotomaculum defluvii]